MRVIAVSILLLVITACSNDGVKISNQSNEIQQSNLVVDPSFQLLLEVQQYTFESLNQNKKININLLYEQDALQSLLADSSKVIVIGRPLSDSEKNIFESQKLFPVVTKIAEDAVVVIANKQSEIDSLTIEQLKELLSKGNDNSLKIVFDNKQSANALYLKDSLLLGSAYSHNVFALNSDAEVINYVAKNKNTLGIISLNRIGDKDDRKTKEILTQVKMLALSKGKGLNAFHPYQAYIKTREYPLVRGIYMINRQKQQTLGTAFVNFVAGEKGQLIVLKSGLVPAFPPQRIIQTTNN